MMPSSCRTAPSGISSHSVAESVLVIMARLRTSDWVIAWFLRWGCGLSARGQRFLFGKGAIDLAAQFLGQLAAQRLGFRGEGVARPRQVDRDDRLDAAGTGGEDDDAIGQRD